MNILDTFHSFFQRFKKPSMDVALVLGGGGARGFAHIGAIEVLQAHGYHITSVAGTSMGALVGGLFVAGKMDKLKAIAHSLNKMQMLKMMDVSPGLDHLASGERLLKELRQLVGEVRIEELSIPFACVASDVVSGQAHVFREGELAQAIRASVSIPCFFKPVEIDGALYVDGSVHNTLPLDVVSRKKGDLLVAVNASAPDEHPLSNTVPATTRENSSFWMRWIPAMKSGLSSNYVNMAVRVACLSVQNNTVMAERLTPPDILADIPMDAFGLFDFTRADEIIAYGRQAMEKALKEKDLKKE